jgi:hypothetical protein
MITIRDRLKYYRRRRMEARYAKWIGPALARRRKLDEANRKIREESPKGSESHKTKSP